MKRLPRVTHAIRGLQRGVKAELRGFWAPVSAARPDLQAASQLPPALPPSPAAAAGYSQLCDVLGDALGQALEVLVAASDHGVQAGAFLGALGAGQAAPLLLAWGRSQVSEGQAFLVPPASRALCGEPQNRSPSLTLPQAP